MAQSPARQPERLPGVDHRSEKREEKRSFRDAEEIGDEGEDGRIHDGLADAEEEAVEEELPKIVRGRGHHSSDGPCDEAALWGEGENEI